MSLTRTDTASLERKRLGYSSERTPPSQELTHKRWYSLQECFILLGIFHSLQDARFVLSTLLKLILHSGRQLTFWALRVESIILYILLSMIFTYMMKRRGSDRFPRCLLAIVCYVLTVIKIALITSRHTSRANEITFHEAHSFLEWDLHHPWELISFLLEHVLYIACSLCTYRCALHRSSRDDDEDDSTGNEDISQVQKLNLVTKYLKQQKPTAHDSSNKQRLCYHTRPSLLSLQGFFARLSRCLVFSEVYTRVEQKPRLPIDPTQAVSYSPSSARRRLFTYTSSPDHDVPLFYLFGTSLRYYWFIWLTLCCAATNVLLCMMSVTTPDSTWYELLCQCCRLSFESEKSTVTSFFLVSALLGILCSLYLSRARVNIRFQADFSTVRTWNVSLQVQSQFPRTTKRNHSAQKTTTERKNSIDNNRNENSNLQEACLTTTHTALDLNLITSPSPKPIVTTPTRPIQEQTPRDQDTSSTILASPVASRIPPPPPSPGVAGTSLLPPPPLPPPPGGAYKDGTPGLFPPPPPPMGFTRQTSAGPKLKNFFWKKLKHDAVERSVWSELSMDVADFIDMDMITEAFEVKPKEKHDTSKGAKQAATQKSHALPPQRAQNVAIALTVLKKSTEMLRDALITCDTETLTSESIETLAKLLPTPEEMRALTQEKRQMESRRAVQVQWTDAEVFLYEIGTTIPDVQERVEAWQYVNEFEVQYRLAQENVDKMEKSLACLMKRNSYFKEVLSLILAIGNALNQGTAHGNARGFSIENLTTLSTVKTADGKATLLDILVRQIIVRKPELLEFLDELAPLHAVRGVSMAAITGQVGSISGGMHLVRRIVENETSRVTVPPQECTHIHVTDNLCPWLRKFQDRAKPMTTELMMAHQHLKAEITSLCDHFGEDPSHFDESVFFGYILTFMKEFSSNRKQYEEKQERIRKANERRLSRNNSLRGSPSDLALSPHVSPSEESLVRIPSLSHISRRRNDMQDDEDDEWQLH